MIDIVPGVRLDRALVDGGAEGFARLSTSLTGPDAESEPAGTVLAVIRVSAASPQAERAQVEWLYPFSWDSADRCVVTGNRTLSPGQALCLHAGPYGTADAAAHRDGVPMVFRSTGDGHRYLPDVSPPRPEDEHQDSAAWVLVALGQRCLVLAWEYSGHLITTVSVGDPSAEDGGLRIVSCLPVDTFSPDADAAVRETPGPVGWLCVLEGGLDDGARALRRLVDREIITAPDLTGMPGDPDFPCLVANSWGVQEDTSTERILAMMDATAAVGAEVFVVDKGWERAVGDWHPNDRFPSGLGWLSGQARRRGMGFGIWCGFGNADPRSSVALEHPDWLAAWRDDIPVLSFDNHAICLGHDAARDWVLAELTRMVQEFGLRWLLHDFETIARCDATTHTHHPRAGEHAAEAAFHHILTTLADRFPGLVLENCWNGVRPLDLAMIRHHHTTITEDHCRTHQNSLAKVGLGRYLPLDWQSAYMGADDLPPKARIAPYVIGGPWVLMDDPEAWSDQTRVLLEAATQAFRRWRRDLRMAEISRPSARPGAVDPVAALTADGRMLLAVSVPPGIDRVDLELGLAPGSYTITDEWTGVVTVRLIEGTAVPFDVDPAGDGLLLGLTPLAP